jgi:hypothetical protein
MWSISNSISIPRGLKYFMLENRKVDFLGNSEVALFLYTQYNKMQNLHTIIQIQSKIISVFVYRVYQKKGDL